VGSALKVMGGAFTDSLYRQKHSVIRAGTGWYHSLLATRLICEC
jgi:hypothetical protein